MPNLDVDASDSFASLSDDAPSPGVETVEVRTADGVSLHVSLLEPRASAPGSRPVGVAVLAHALYARRTEFVRRDGGGLGPFLAKRGWRVLAFDFRGHGGSGKPASKGFDWSYEDLVERDLPAVVDAARLRSDGAKLVVVGHSMGGHVSLAAQGTGRIQADALVGFAWSTWLPEFEPSLPQRLARGAIATSMGELTKRRGYFPARMLRLGSDAESKKLVRTLTRIARKGEWTSPDGRADYRRALADVKVPVYAIGSDGDRICPADLVDRFSRAIPGPVTFDRIRRSDGGGAAPGHAAMLTTDAALGAWGRAEAWMRGR